MISYYKALFERKKMTKVYSFILFSQGNDGDCQGHGTHCAGIIAGKRYGVAKAAKVYAVRVLGCYNYGSWSSIIDGQ